MNIDPSIFKAYDIRGVYPTHINEENYPFIIKAIYTFFLKDLQKESLQVVLSRDMRVSGPALYEVAKNTLLKLGATVIDVGLASTPSFYYAALKYGYDVGIHISASHNPKEYTGIKFAKRVGNGLIKIGKTTGMDEIKQLVLSGTFAPEKEGGKIVKNEHVLEDEIDEAVKDIGIEGMKEFKIVIDPANAMGCIFLPKLFEKVPGKLIIMNGELDGTFPVHQPDPLHFENLKGLQERVVAEKADLGITTDGDGDRVFFVNEKGEVIKATSITSLVANFILKTSPGEKIIADIRDIRNVKEVCKKLGGTFLMSMVGHAHITKQLNDEGAAFAGESSGHFYFGKTGGGESSIRIILYVLKSMSEEGKPISEIISEYVTSYESEEINFIIPQPLTTAVVLETIEKKFSDASINKIDGLSLDYSDWRANIRSSNTEPLCRLNVEGATKELVEQKVEDIKNIILSLGGRLK